MSIDPERLSSLSLFRDAPACVVSTLAGCAREMSFDAGVTLFDAGSAPRGWYVVLHGAVRVVSGNALRQHVVHTERPGGTLGEVPVFTSTTHPATGVAIEPTTCAVFDRATLLSAMRDCPEIGFVINQRLAARVRHLVERLAQRTRGVRGRLAQFLLHRLEVSRSAPALSLGMTQRALAEEFGTVREVLARELRLLVRDRVLKQLGGGRYQVLDIDELRRRSSE